MDKGDAIQNSAPILSGDDFLLALYGVHSQSLPKTTRPLPPAGKMKAASDLSIFANLIGSKVRAQS